MLIRRLALHQLRRFSAVDLSPQPGLNLLTGDNGAGKTSVLEALHLMAGGISRFNDKWCRGAADGSLFPAPCSYQQKARKILERIGYLTDLFAQRTR